MTDTASYQMFGERAFEKRSSRLSGTSVYFSTCFTLICLLLLHKAGSNLEVILNPHEVFVGETFSVSCLLNSSRLAQGLTLGREGIWDSDANKNGNQNGRDFDSFAQSSLLKFRHSSKTSSKPCYEIFAAFSLNSTEAYFAPELDEDIHYSITRDGEIINATLTSARACYEFGGLYLCEANADGEDLTSASEYLGVKGLPEITKVGSLPKSAILGFPVSLVCRFFSSSEPFRVVWHHHGSEQDISGRESLVRVEDSDMEWRARLRLGVLTPSLTGEYSCTVENQYGNASQSCSLDPTPLLQMEMLEEGNWTWERTNGKSVYLLEAGKETSITVRCIAGNMDGSSFDQFDHANLTGIQTLARSRRRRFLWNLKTTAQSTFLSDLPETTTVSISTRVEKNGGVAYVTSVLRLSGVDYSLAGQLECAIPDKHVIYKDTLPLEVVGMPVVVAASETVVANTGELVILTCNVTTNPGPDSVLWMFEGAVVQDDGRHTIKLMDVKTLALPSILLRPTPVYYFILKIAQFREEDKGTYICQIANQYGQASASVNLGLCAPGYEPDGSSAICKDLDECLISPSPCEFHCHNVNGSYFCSCPSDFLLSDDGRSCDFSIVGSSSDPEDRRFTALPVIAGILSTVVLLVFAVGGGYGLRWRRRRNLRDSILRSLHEHKKRSRNQAHTKFTNYKVPGHHDISGEFPRERLRLLTIVGEGKFGQVWSAHALNIIGTGQWELVAVKMCKESTSDVDKLDFLNEVSLVSEIPRHLNVVNYLGCCTAIEPSLLIMEFITGGDLLRFLRKHRTYPLYENPSTFDKESLPSAERAELRHTDTATWAQQAREMKFTNITFEPDDISVDDVMMFVRTDDRNGATDVVDTNTVKLSDQNQGEVDAKTAGNTVCNEQITKTGDKDGEMSLTITMKTSDESASPIQSGRHVISQLTSEKNNPEQNSAEETRNPPLPLQQVKSSNWSASSKNFTMPAGNRHFEPQLATQATVIQTRNDAAYGRDAYGLESILNKETVQSDARHVGVSGETDETNRMTVRKSSDASSGNSQTAFISISKEEKAVKRPARRVSSFSLRGKTLTSDAVSVASYSPALHRKRSHPARRQQSSCDASLSTQGDPSSHSDSEDNDDIPGLAEIDHIEDISAGKLFAFALQIARGMRHLSENKIIHRDLAARNVLVTDKGVCKITDFGLARSMDESDSYERTSKGALPIRWMSPEALTHGSHSTKSDVWAYGVLLWEIVTLGASPYPGMSARDVFRFVNSGRKMDRPDHCGLELYGLMEECWAYQPADRPDFSHVCCCLEELLEREQDYISLDQFQSEHYTYLEPTCLDEKL